MAKKGAKYLILLVGVILAFIFLFPVYILVINSFKSLRDIYSDILAFPIGDMFTVAKALSASQTSLLPLVFAGVFYYIFNFIVAFFMESIEKKLNYYH